MDYQRFIAELPKLYNDWGQESIRPQVGQFQAVIEQIDGMTTANIAQLLNFAVACMEPDEVYCEVGCGSGSNLIGALLNHPNRMAYAIDTEFDPPCENQESLIQNLVRFNLEEQVFFCSQDFEAFFADLRELESSDRIGVYFYDGAHDYRSHLMGLLLVRPFLAERALIILNDSNWDGVQQATWDFIAAHRECNLLLDLPTPGNAHPTFGNGIQVLRWDTHASHHHDWSALAQQRKTRLIQAIGEIPPLDQTPQATHLESLQQQAQHLQATGQLAEAEQVYRTILQQNSNLARVWHALGMVYFQMQQYGDAIGALSKALELDQSNAPYHYSLGLVHEVLEQFTEAAIAYQTAIVLDANLVNAYSKLGSLVLKHGDPAQVEIICQQGISVDPQHLDNYLNLGDALLIQKKVEAAIAAYETALQLKPNAIDIRQNLELARKFSEDEVQACIFAGNSLHQRQRYREAAIHYQRLLDLQQTDLDIYTVLADCYEQTHQYEAVVRTCQQGILHHPVEQVEQLSIQLIQALQKTNQTEEAIAQATHYAQQFPDNPYFRFQQHLLIPLIYQTTEEIERYRSHFTQGLSTLIQETLPLLSERGTVAQRILEDALSRHTNFFLPYQNANVVELQKQYGQLVHQVMAANYPQWVKAIAPRGSGGEGEQRRGGAEAQGTRDKNETPSTYHVAPNKIRIGYISGCMWEHTVGKIIIGWFRHHNREQFEIYSYSLSDKNDSLTQQFQHYSDAFHQIPDNLEAICQQILADQLDILVFFDLGLHPLMTQLAALRLAPVQCTTWAHPITSGLPTIDYFLSNDLMEPDNAQEHYSEKLIRLPNIGISFAKPQIPEPTKPRSAFQLRENAVVYLTNQMLSKYLPEQDRVLTTIAQQVPNAQFVFVARPNVTVAHEFQHRLQQAFSEVGLDSDRYCVMLSQLNQVDYWNLNQLADVFLDTFGWCGGQTTLEAAVCNLPIVTRPGEFMRGRQSYAILAMMGVTDTIAQTDSEYIDIAVRLGKDNAWRSAIIKRMIDRHSYLYDDTACMSALETFYRRVCGKSGNG